MNEQLLKCTVTLAERMLVAGAEVHRVEECVGRICYAYGAARADAFITTSNMVVTVETVEGEFLTQTRRLSGTGINMAKVHALSNLARRVVAERPALPELEEMLEQASRSRRYPRWLQVFSYVVIAGAFTIFFGAADWREALISAVIGSIVGVAAQFSERFSLNKALERFVGSFLACLLAFCAVRWGAVTTADKIIIGNIMSLIPGTGLTNAIRDLFTGDVITGILRSIEAILLALAIAAGYVIAVFLMGGGF